MWMPPAPGSSAIPTLLQIDPGMDLSTRPNTLFRFSARIIKVESGHVLKSPPGNEATLVVPPE